MRFKVTPPPRAKFQKVRDATLDVIGREVARGVDIVTVDGTRKIKSAMAGVGLGKLSRAVKATSDYRKKRVPLLSRAGARFRAGGVIYLSGNSERTQGAFDAYSKGATILPRRGRWLAFPTDEIPKRAGRFKMTPRRYEAVGLDRRIGELEFIPGKTPGEAFLIVRDVTVDRARGFGKARRRARNGNVPANRAERDFVVAFILIRATKRSRRFNPQRIAEAAVRRLPLVLARLKSQRQSTSAPTLFSTSGSATGRFLS